jgi:hypothetical protein
MKTIVGCRINSVSEWGTDENIWSLEGRGNRGVEKLSDVGLHDLYSSPTIVRVIKSIRMRWAGHVAGMEEGRNVCRVLVEKPEGKRPMGNPVVVGSVILTFILLMWTFG